NSIILELQIRKKYLNNSTLETIYFGGGTPSILTNSELARIFAAITSNYGISHNCEITFEANPDDINSDKLDQFISQGINRLSIGIQSFDDSILKSLNRVHSATEAIKSVDLAKSKGIDNISIDLIYGIPGLSMQKWKDSLNIYNKMDIPHLSSYFLTVEEKTALDVLIRKGKYPKLKEEEGLAHFDYLLEFCDNNNIEQYEISNFCKKASISKHNTNYWKNNEYLGIGPSAHSYNLISRQWNKSSINNYIADINNKSFSADLEILSEKDKFNEFVMLGLRTMWGIDISEIENRFGSEYQNYLLNYIKNNIKNGFIEFNDNILKLSLKGKKYADGIASDLFMI
ncbi:MAG: coproporphyrinogen III oxidase, partial [Bacteroidetes bacterium 4572_112]